MSEWLRGFLSGVIATVIGCIITMVWDVFKLKREAKEKENKIMSVIKEDLKNNFLILSEDFDLVRHELEIIDRGLIINPLVPLKTGFWDLAKIYLPKELLQGDTLAKLRDVVMKTEQINEIIQSRENFRIHNSALTNYVQQLKSYDGLFVTNTKIMQDLMAKLDPLLVSSEKQIINSAIITGKK